MNEGQPAAASLTISCLVVFFVLAGPVLALAPLGMAPLVIAASVVATMTERIVNRRWPRLSGSPLYLSALFLIWCAISLAWDINIRDGAAKLLALVVIFGSALVLLGIASKTAPEHRKRLAYALVSGAVIGLVLLAVETIFGFPIYRAVMGHGSPKLDDLLESKRSVDAMPLIVWPAALALERLRRPWLGALLAVAFTVASFKLTASASELAMLAGVALLGFASLWAVSARRVLIIGTLAAFVLIIPASIFLYDVGGATNPALKYSARQRVEIWHFAAEHALHRPLFGYGLDASRFMPNGGAVSIFQAPDKPIIPLHPHDAFLQIWLELGIVGVAVAAAILVSMLNAIRTWPPSAARFALPAYAAAAIVAGLAFGIWQVWWLATLAFGLIACRFVVTTDRDYA
jgi:O-antigen ligase